MTTLCVVAGVWLVCGLVVVLLDAPPEPSAAGVLNTVSALVLALAAVPYGLGFLTFVVRSLFLAGYRKAQEWLEGPQAEERTRG